MKLTNKKRQKKRYPAIRINDKVQVISGKDKGVIGKVLSIDWAKERVLVEGVNVATRHVKARNQRESGEIVKSEAPIHYSNILLYSPDAERGVRVRIDKPESKVKRRVCVKTANIIE